MIWIFELGDINKKIYNSSNFVLLIKIYKNEI